MSLARLFTDRQLEFIKIMAEFDNPGVSIERYLQLCLQEYITQQANDTEFVEDMCQRVGLKPNFFAGAFPDPWDEKEDQVVLLI